ncbi:chromosome segregation protein SMC [Clostridium hydrogeniformans]|uniref:chromosome segregation protein SMC n=1 Tax=Clostridium hydrogeniformans TaxID=349933 RepID=UPI000488E631|nr:chromosome segregation protein SMC [Clostridium hydrogeniformans]
MFLKSIEIRGFKSFADKIELDFKQGVTAVVGPNGSGKSNISDAIRWVLGEQSAKSLRGGKMEDVIFAGTQYRKPVGLAQVALTLDNAEGELPIDYSDVTISRRLYRSGESEYYINNTSCRLKDIHELFMDTGIGKEGYSIIGQGKIDAILSGKAEERRALLEEAAGIVKFKTRKEEAEKKLNNTEQNLVRINDILGTYEERIEPLRIENEKAGKFIALSEELKTLEISLIVDSIDKVKNNAKGIDEEIKELNKTIEGQEKERNEFKGISEKLENTLEDEDKKSSEDKVIYYSSKEKSQELEGEIQLLNERIKNIDFNIEKNYKEIEEEKHKVKSLIDNKKENEEKLLIDKENQKLINEQIETLEKTIQDYNKGLKDIERGSIDLRDKEIKALRDIASEENKIEMLNKDIESLSSKLKVLETSYDNSNNSLKINITTKNMLDGNKEELLKKIESINEDIKSSRKEMNRLLSVINQNEKVLKEKNIKFNKLEANHQMLRNLHKQYEGYARAVKLIMKEVSEERIPNMKGNCHVLGEIIKVKKEYETAIEISLGGGISDIITENESQAKILINHLKKNNLGRATFLPLTIIKGRKVNLNDNIKKIKGYIGIASELISYDEKFTPAINYVLGRTIICNSMDEALNFAKYTDYSYKIVTLQGEVINPGGALTGGSIYNKNVNIIGRKREIEGIEKELNEISKDLRDLNAKVIIEKNSFKNLDDKCLNLKDEVHFNNIEVTRIQGEISSIVNENTKLKEALEVSLKEKELISKKITRSYEELELKKENIVKLKEEEESIKRNKELREKELLSKEENLTIHKENLVELKVKKAQIDETLGSEIKEIRRLENDIKELTLKEELKNSDIDKNILSKKESLRSIEENKKLIEELNKKIQGMKSDFETYEANRVKLKEEIKLNNNKIESLTLDLNKLEDSINKKSITKAKYEVEENSLYSKLNEDMNLTLAEALDLSIEVVDLEDFKGNIGRLKGKISSLGTVNLGAIEEYEEVTTKYKFMSTQREDLDKAKEELVSVIGEMTSKMKDVFNSNFKILKENFNETFRELFKGGSADLILGEGDELSANIEINVQPPGKKLQNISLMSGGEKVLSAIALLFAILKMKPTPFCILDEIEAALDDANVNRYAEFLKQFAGNIQFIVITHRKGTMEASDILYGVTMEEKGVSKVVSVDLSA